MHWKLPITFLSLLLFTATAAEGKTQEVEELKRRLRGATTTTISDQMATALKEQSRNLVQQCTDTSCAAERIRSEVSKFKTTRSSLTGELEPILGIFDDVGRAFDKLKLLNDIVQPVKVALSVVSAIPKAGLPFKPPLTLIKAITPVLKSLETSMDSSLMAVSKPFVLSIESILSKIGSLETTLLSMSGGISGFVESVGDSSCAKEFFSLIAPPFDTAYGATEQAILELDSLVTQLVSIIQSLEAAIDGPGWKDFVDGVDLLIDGIDIFFTPIEEMKLEDVLDQRIPTPLPGTVYVKPITDPLSDCPRGYKDVGAACNNPFFKIRHQMPAKPRVTIRGIKYRCTRDNYDRVRSVLCWKKCPSGWRKKDHGVLGACFKSCPDGMKIDPTGKLCMKKFGCPSDHDMITGLCHKKCKSGEIDLGLSCISKKLQTIKLGDIVDIFNDAINGYLKYTPAGVIKDLYEPLIESAVKDVLAPFLESALGIPDITKIPNVPNLSTILPTEAVGNALDNFEPFDVINKLHFDMVTDKISELVGNLGISSDLGDLDIFNDCGSDMNCMLKKFDFPIDLPDEISLVFPNIESLLQETDFSDANIALTSLVSAFGGCKEFKQTNIPMVASIADFIDTNGSGNGECSLDIDVCTNIDIDQQLFEESMTKLKSVFSPFHAMIGQAAGGDNKSNRNLASFSNKIIANEELEWKWVVAIPELQQMATRLIKRLPEAQIRDAVLLFLNKKTQLHKMMFVSNEISVNPRIFLGGKGTSSFFLGVDLQIKVSLGGAFVHSDIDNVHRDVVNVLNKQFDQVKQLFDSKQSIFRGCDAVAAIARRGKGAYLRPFISGPVRFTGTSEDIQGKQLEQLQAMKTLYEKTSQAISECKRQSNPIDLSFDLKKTLVKTLGSTTLAYSFPTEKDDEEADATKPATEFFGDFVFDIGGSMELRSDGFADQVELPGAIFKAETKWAIEPEKRGKTPKEIAVSFPRGIQKVLDQATDTLGDGLRVRGGGLAVDFHFEVPFFKHEFL